jgi:hypothetical protein
MFAPHPNVWLDLYLNNRAKPQCSADAHTKLLLYLLGNKLNTDSLKDNFSKTFSFSSMV